MSPIIPTTAVDRELFGRNWTLFLLWGIFLIILGIFAIGASVLTTLLTIIIVGTLLLLAGVVIIIDAFNYWWTTWGSFFIHFITGFLYGLVGFLMIFNPVWASLYLTLLLGVFYLLVGIFRIVYVLSYRRSQWGWSLLSGLVALLLGVLILSNWPATSLFIIGLFVGIDLIVSGWAYTMLALAARRVIP